MTPHSPTKAPSSPGRGGGKSRNDQFSTYTVSGAAPHFPFLTLLNSEVVPRGHLTDQKTGSEGLGHWATVSHG